MCDPNCCYPNCFPAMTAYNTCSPNGDMYNSPCVGGSCQPDVMECSYNAGNCSTPFYGSYPNYGQSGNNMSGYRANGMNVPSSYRANGLNNPPNSYGNGDFNTTLSAFIAPSPYELNLQS